MKGDIAFAGFVLTAEEWQQLDRQSRAQLIAVATGPAEPWPAPLRVEGSGEIEIVELDPNR
jgi:hypothetical protein